MADVDRQYREFKEQIESKALSVTKRAELLSEKYDELQKTIDPHRKVQGWESGKSLHLWL